ncbi:MAG: redoxin domain-containing protein [Syntrophobacteraceae bacterium]|nr:redoxin domain-containing protein [Syntrophobacteraceae bacterium]
MKKREFAILCQIIICSLILFMPRTGAAFGFDAAKRFESAKVTFPAPDSTQAEKYLGLKAMKPFTVGDVKAKVVVIEFMSALCEYCSLNSKVMNNIYKTVQENPQLAANAKVMAIGMANSDAELNAFKKQHGVLFPMLNDADGSIGTAMGNMPTPTTLIVSTATGKVLFSHVGVIWSSDGFVKKIENLINKS